jgi:hypothetical protein
MHDHPNHPTHTAIGIVMPLLSALWATTTEAPWWVPLGCAIVAALVPISNNLTKLWLARQAERRSATVARIVALTAENAALRSAVTQQTAQPTERNTP